jgi:hypothetical protein
MNIKYLYKIYLNKILNKGRKTSIKRNIFYIIIIIIIIFFLRRLRNTILSSCRHFIMPAFYYKLQVQFVTWSKNVIYLRLKECHFDNDCPIVKTMTQTNLTCEIIKDIKLYFL